MSSIRSFFVYYFIITGTFFLVSTAVGMLRFPDFYTRLHAGSKCLVAGGISIMIGCIIMEGISPVSLKLLIIIFVLLVTNPVAVHAIARSAYNSGLIPDNLIKNDLQKTETKKSETSPGGEQ